MLYLKDTQNWKQFTTTRQLHKPIKMLCYISKILKIESNSQRSRWSIEKLQSCVISQRYSKLKAIHNSERIFPWNKRVVLYLKDTQNWKQFTTRWLHVSAYSSLCYISKILKIESNSQPSFKASANARCCVISQRYSKLKAIHNTKYRVVLRIYVVLYLKDTQNWKQFTTSVSTVTHSNLLCYISKILKIESNSQRERFLLLRWLSCVISQRYSKLKAIHNRLVYHQIMILVVLYLKDTQKWKQFRTEFRSGCFRIWLCYISKILKIESNSQLRCPSPADCISCVISQRYSKLKAIHNRRTRQAVRVPVVLYLKDTQNWKQFTTFDDVNIIFHVLCYISKILKIESNSQLSSPSRFFSASCVISQRYSKLKAIHNRTDVLFGWQSVVLYLKDTQNWKQFTTPREGEWLLPELCYISKILKIESNSQRIMLSIISRFSCVISQRYSKLKAIHNFADLLYKYAIVVLYLKDTQNWKQFTTTRLSVIALRRLCYISKILKIESNSQPSDFWNNIKLCCVISQRYSKLKAIHNVMLENELNKKVVLYLKDTQNWKQFTTHVGKCFFNILLCYISKILKIESNSQRKFLLIHFFESCVISQRYSKLKAIHNTYSSMLSSNTVVLYLKDTQNWKQFTTPMA